MRNLHGVFLTCATLSLLPGAMVAQEGDRDDRTPTMRELWAAKSSDGRNHETEAIALGRSGNNDVLYTVERNSEPMPGKDGDHLLWKLDANGRVLHKEFLGKMPNRQPPRVTVVPLPAPQEGAIIVGVFEDRFGWSMLRVDGAGKIAKSVKLIHEPGAFTAAVLLPDAKGLLLAGQFGFKGNVWKVDLDGNAIWKKTYRPKDMPDDTKTAAKGRSNAGFFGIAVADDRGGFVAAGDFGEINKFGLGQRSIWLTRCDAAGAVLSEAAFPGRYPSVCAIGRDRFAILYDGGAAMQSDCRVRAIDLGLKEQWEKGAQFSTFLVDGPAIAPIPSNRGFVMAGCNVVVDKAKKTVKRESRCFQYGTGGQCVSLASIRVASEVFLHAHVACGVDRAYVACQTKGVGPWDAKEAGIFEIVLRRRDQ